MCALFWSMKTIDHPKTQCQINHLESAINEFGQLSKVVGMSAWPREMREALSLLHKAHDKIHSMSEAKDRRAAK